MMASMAGNTFKTSSLTGASPESKCVPENEVKDWSSRQKDADAVNNALNDKVKGGKLTPEMRHRALKENLAEKGKLFEAKTMDPSGRIGAADVLGQSQQASTLGRAAAGGAAGGAIGQ